MDNPSGCRKLLRHNSTKAPMVNAVRYPKYKGTNMGNTGVARHQYAGSSARRAYGTQRGESRTGPALSDGGQIECAGNAGSATVSAGCGLADLSTADHGTCVTCRGLARFEHHNTHSLRKFADIPSPGQKHRAVCTSVSGRRVTTRNTWRMR